MKVLITGSSGQIGTNTALALLEGGHKVRGVDINRNAWTDKIETAVTDLTRGSLEDLHGNTQYQVVLHLAAHAKVYELVEHPRRAMENITMLFKVLEYCRTSNTPIVFGSSREVYGDIQQWTTKEHDANFVVAESPYSASKISGEAMIYAYHQCYGLPYLVFRFSNVYGRYDSDAERMERVVPLFIQRIARDRPITVYGKQKTLDFTYVDDCTQGVIKGLEAVSSGRIAAETINLAYGQGNTLLDLVNMIAMALGKTPSITFAEPRAGEIQRYIADISNARNLLGYEPTTPLSGGIPRAIAWQRSMGILEI